MEYNNGMTPPPYYGGGNNAGALTRQVNAVMKRVYVRMFIGLLISAFCALGVASSPGALQFFYGNSWMMWVLFGGILAIAWIMPGRLHKMSSGTTLMWFCVFAALMGITLSSVFLVYSLKGITTTFFISAGTFGAMSVYGYCTKTDLSKFGSYLMMGLFGLIIVMLVNIFLKSTQLEWAISIIGVLLFIGLTAWDTQQVKQLARMNLEPSMADKLATIGAMNLYLDFINLFLFLLRFFGGSRD